ncbi:hypothetical protein AKG39_07005 [Acetobacterium bakii]|uniref:DUF3786 domain-containing protein n=1 Tax=Acetobacterium bakii TaxID=52689 RepID=A0A0L6U1L6_9FIRM|nr:hypothetical protein AKG39_07005 [Acetobacterium bakii]
MQEIDPHFSESSYIVSRDLVKNHDPLVMSQNSQCSYDAAQGMFSVPVLGEGYSVHYPSGEVLNSKGEDFDNYSVKIIVLRYLMNAKAGINSGEMVSFKEFPDGALYYPNFYKRCLQVFANIGNEMPEALKKYMDAINASPMGKGDLSWQFTFMPGVKIACILWFGDDEFEAEGQILFDKSLTKVFNIKDLAILGDVFMISLKTFTFSL